MMKLIYSIGTWITLSSFFYYLICYKWKSSWLQIYLDGNNKIEIYIYEFAPFKEIIISNPTAKDGRKLISNTKSEMLEIHRKFNQATTGFGLPHITWMSAAYITLNPEDSITITIKDNKGKQLYHTLYTRPINEKKDL